MSSGPGFNYQQIASSMGQTSSSPETNIRSFSQTMDPGSTSDLIKLQNMTQQWTTAVNVQSTTLAMVSETLKNLVQKADSSGSSSQNSNPPNSVKINLMSTEKNSIMKEKANIATLLNMLKAKGRPF